MAKDIFITGTGGVALFFETLESVTDAILKILEDNEKFVRSKHILKDYAKTDGQNLLLYAPAEFSFKDVWKKLEDENVPFVIGFKKDEGKPYIIIRDCDKEKIKQIQTNLYIEKRRISEITNAEFYNYFKDENGQTMSFSGLTHYQVKRLGEIAQKNDFIFTRKATDDGKYTIFIYSDDSKEELEKINKAMLTLSCESAGTISMIEEAKSDVDKDIIRNAIERGLTTKTHFYVANASIEYGRKEFVEITDESFTVFKNGEASQTYEKKEDSSYENHLAIALLSIRNPVVLDEDHFKVSGERFEENIKATSNEKDIKVSNSIKEKLKKNKAITSKGIRHIEDELKKKILDWIEDPESNKIKSVNDLVSTVDEKYHKEAEKFIDAFSNTYAYLSETKVVKDIDGFEELQKAANLEEFIPSFDNNREEEKAL